MEDRSVPATISGYAFLDLNANGLRDPGEGVVAGVGVGLTPTSSAPLNTRTDRAGYYAFTGLAPDSYTLRATPPAGYGVTTPPGGTAAINIATAADAVGVGIGLSQGSSSGSGLPVISMTAVNVREGSSGDVVLTRTGGDQSQPLTVAYTIGGTATPGNPGDPGADYQTLSGTVTFGPGSPTVAVTIAAFTDGVYDPDETVALTIYPTSQYVLADNASSAMASNVILDVPPPPPTSPPPPPPPPPEPIIGTGTGLLGRYFNTPDFHDLGLAPRVDPKVDFDWGTGSPDPAINPDRFSVMWTGQVQAEYTDNYIFKTTSDDGIRLWVNGELIIDNWTDHSVKTDSSAPIALTAGQKYDITVEYYENTTAAVAKLSWSGTLQPEEVIPTSQLYPEVPPTPVAGTGTGLLGTYNDDADPDRPRVSRVDPQVNFDWGTGSPHAAVPADMFVVKWTGEIQPRYTGYYDFSTVTDDGVQLWVNNRILIDDWNDHPPTEDRGLVIFLTAGVKYPIAMAYYEKTGGAVAKLYWSSENQVKEVVPQAQLYPATTDHPPVFNNPSNPTDPKTFTVNIGIGSNAGTFVATLFASDPDDDDLTYQIVWSDDMWSNFTVAAGADGAKVSLASSLSWIPLFPYQTQYTLLVRADDGRGGYDTARLIVNVKPGVFLGGDYTTVEPLPGQATTADTIRLVFNRIDPTLTYPELRVRYQYDWTTWSDLAAAHPASPADLEKKQPDGTWAPLPAGATFDEVVIPAGASTVEVDLRAVTDPAEGREEFKAWVVDNPGQDYAHGTGNAPGAFTSDSLQWSYLAKLTIFDAVTLFGWNNIDALKDPAGSQGVALNDIAQGSVGDCYLLAAVGAIAKSNPQLIRDKFIEEANGDVSMYFFPTLGQAAVKETVPMTLIGGTDQAAVLGDTNDTGKVEVWVQMFEKLYSKFLTDYFPDESLNGGFANTVWDRLTGSPVLIVNTAGSTAADFAAQLQTALANNTPTVISTKPSFDSKVVLAGWDPIKGRLDATQGQELISRHDYILYGQMPEDGRFILYNPWAKQHVLITADELMAFVSRATIMRSP